LTAAINLVSRTKDSKWRAASPPAIGSQESDEGRIVANIVRRQPGPRAFFARKWVLPPGVPPARVEYGMFEHCTVARCVENAYALKVQRRESA
jgi:hypothetical protein